MTPVIRLKSVAERTARSQLHGRVQRGANGQSAIVELVLAVEIENLPTDLLHEIIGRQVLRAGQALSAFQRHGLRGIHLFARDVTIGVHALEHPVAPADGRGALALGMVVGRALGQSGQICGLMKVQLVQ